MPDEGSDLVQQYAQRRVFGFHGNTRGSIEAAIEGQFQRPGLSGDWLGAGFYLWQDAPNRAWDWADAVVARSRDGSAEPAVIIAELEWTSNWIDLIEKEPWAERFQRAAEKLEHAGLLPQQTSKLAASALHERDYAIIEYALNRLAPRGSRVDAIRCAFVEGNPVSKASAIFDRTHVQIAIRRGERVIRYQWLLREST